MTNNPKKDYAAYFDRIERRRDHARAESTIAALKGALGPNGYGIGMPKMARDVTAAELEHLERLHDPRDC